MIKTIFFDLDGTLADSLLDLATSCNYALAKHGYNTHETEKYKYFVGDGMQKLIERILPENSRNNEIKAQVFDTFWKHYTAHYYDNTLAYKGIYELLAALKEKGYIIAVISNKADEMCQAVVNKLFPDTFDLVCGKLENYPTKPDPALFNLLTQKLGVMPCDCIMVGDSGMDMKTAVNAGAVGVGVLWGFRTKDELLSNGARYIIENPIKLLDILGEIN